MPCPHFHFITAFPVLPITAHTISTADRLSDKRPQAHQRRCCCHQNATENWPREVARLRCPAPLSFAAVTRFRSRLRRSRPTCRPMHARLRQRIPRCGCSVSSVSTRQGKRHLILYYLCAIAALHRAAHCSFSPRRPPPSDWPGSSFAGLRHVTAAVGVLSLRADLGDGTAPPFGPIR
jgi:hypothetical protein